MCKCALRPFGLVPVGACVTASMGTSFGARPGSRALTPSNLRAPRSNKTACTVGSPSASLTRPLQHHCAVVDTCPRTHSIGSPASQMFLVDEERSESPDTSHPEKLTDRPERTQLEIEGSCLGKAHHGAYRASERAGQNAAMFWNEGERRRVSHCRPKGRCISAPSPKKWARANASGSQWGTKLDEQWYCCNDCAGLRLRNSVEQAGSLFEFVFRDDEKR